MKRILAKLMKGEKGQALIIILILLLFGGILITALLGYMNTGHKAGQTNENLMKRLYAADAGVEYGLQKIITKDTLLPTSAGDNQTYDLPGNVNGMTVDPVKITYIDEKTFKINSTAIDSIGGKTNIESYVNILYFFNFMNNAITSRNDVNIQPGGSVTGNVSYSGDLTGGGSSSINGTVTQEEIEGWPTAQQLQQYYWEEVKNLPPPWYEYADDTIDVKDTANITLGMYRDGDLTIINKGSDNLTLGLGGVVYITGNLEVGQTNKQFILDLNGQTIFVEGDVNFGGKVTIAGSGCIIGIGDVNFQPQMESYPGDFVFVMSVEGTLNFQPHGDFYGSIAGDAEVNFQPGCDLFWSGPPPTLKYPGADPSEHNVIQAIRTWEITS